MDTTNRSDAWPHGYGKCRCGCGQDTPPAPRTDTRIGYVKGQPRQYVPHHHKHRDWLITEVPAPGFPEPCHVWQRSLNAGGYGIAWHQGKSAKAHRVAWVKANGPVPLGYELDHLCRNRACCNPEHLEVVKRATNTRRGLSTKLTKAQALAIREDPRSQREIAKEYRISQSHVSSIKRRAKWAVDMGPEAE